MTLFIVVLSRKAIGQPWTRRPLKFSRKNKASIGWKSQRKTSRRCLPTANRMEVGKGKGKERGRKGKGEKLLL